MDTGSIVGVLAGLAGLVTAVVAYRKSGPERDSLIVTAAEKAVSTTVVATDQQEKTLQGWIEFLEARADRLEATIIEKDGLIEKQRVIIDRQARLIERYEVELDALRSRVTVLETALHELGVDPTEVG